MFDLVCIKKGKHQEKQLKEKHLVISKYILNVTVINVSFLK